MAVQRLEQVDIEQEKSGAFPKTPAARVKSGTFLKGAAILAGAAVVSKLIGTLQKIPLQNMAGDRVFGIYNAVYPLYILILTLATAGIPLAVSKFVADDMARGDVRGASRVVRLASLLLLGTGIISCVLLFACADTLSGIMGMREAATAIRSAALALLVVPVMAALRGYFQGLGDMTPTAVSQVIEQSARVSVMIALLIVFMHMDASPSWLAAGATFGSAAGGLAGFAVLLMYWRRRASILNMTMSEGRHSSEGHKGVSSAESVWSFYRRFTAYALPLCLGTIALPVLGIVDTFTVPRMLLHYGLTEEGAAHAFGIYNHGLPLVQLVTMIATSMSAALVPAVAQAAAEQDGVLLRKRTEPILHFTWLFALAAAVGLSVTSYPVDVMLFRSGEGHDAGG